MEKANCIKWDFQLLRKIAKASGKNPDGLRYTIVTLAKNLNIELPKSNIRRKTKNNYRTVGENGKER